MEIGCPGRDKTGPRRSREGALGRLCCSKAPSYVRGMGRDWPDGPSGLCREGSGTSGGFQAEGRQRNVLLGKRKVWGASSSGAQGYETRGAEE